MTTSVLTLRLFGTLEARIGNTPLIGLHLREGEHLLAYLTLSGGAVVSYRQLAQQFWPAESTGLSQWGGGSFPSTRQAIYALRRTLGEHAGRLVSAGKGMIRFDLEGAEVDFLLFQQLAAQADCRSWQKAVALYRGPLLEGWPEKWAGEHRIRCQHAYDRLAARIEDKETGRQGDKGRGKREEGKGRS